VTGLVTIPAASLRGFATAAFEAVGVPPADAALTADTLVEADLRGVHSHGTWWLTTYTRRLRQGGLNPRPNLCVLRETPAMALLDADDALGQVASAAAMRLALEKGAASGVGAVGVRNSNHFGAAAYYAMLALPQHQIGFATTDAEATMGPAGGAKLTVGNNPLAFAVPTGSDFPLVLDMAQSVVAWGKIFLAAQRGERIPPGWALDAAGRPTEDPQAAMDGLLLPVGGHKGYGLALMLEVLAGVLTGGAFGLGMPPMADASASQGHGHFFLAVDIAHFLPLDEFYARMGTLIAEQRSAPPAPGVDRTYLPGEIEHLKREARLREGLPLEPYVVASLHSLAEELGIPASFA
jgi:LDH2 family malate/lactate/ureidoglycolate dehydrogenase